MIQTVMCNTQDLTEAQKTKKKTSQSRELKVAQSSDCLMAVLVCSCSYTVLFCASVRICSYVQVSQCVRERDAGSAEAEAGDRAAVSHLVPP